MQQDLCLQCATNSALGSGPKIGTCAFVAAFPKLCLEIDKLGQVVSMDLCILDCAELLQHSRTRATWRGHNPSGANKQMLYS